LRELTRISFGRFRQAHSNIASKVAVRGVASAFERNAFCDGILRKVGSQGVGRQCVERRGDELFELRFQDDDRVCEKAASLRHAPIQNEES
jgi:hypothetical protein